MSDENTKVNALAEAEARLSSAFEENLQKFEAQIKEQIAEIETRGEANAVLGDELAETKESLSALRVELEKVRAQMDTSIANTASAPEGQVGIIAKFQESREDFEESVRDSVARGRPFKFAIKMDGEPLFERKTTITSTAVGSSTPGILTPERVVGTVPLAERQFTIRDLLNSRPTSSNTVEFVRENTFTNAASPQVEGSAKDESAFTFSIASEAVRTIAHWIPATAQVLDDWDELMRNIQRKMLYGLKLKEETEILTGSGTGQHLNGLSTQATAYAGTYDAAGDTRLDTLLHATTELAVADEQADFMVISPVSLDAILSIKDAASNVGNYVVGDPISGGFLRGITLWGKALIVTNSIGTNNFLVGNSQQAEVFDRQAANVAVSTEHASYFTSNLVAIRVEERLALAVYRTSAFNYGTFS